MTLSNKAKQSGSVILLSFFLFAIPKTFANEEDDTPKAGPPSKLDPTEFKDVLKRRTFDFFWETMDTNTYQIPDRYPTKTFTSIASTGFGLAAYVTGIENNYISRKEGTKRILNTLTWLSQSAQGPQKRNTTGYKGFFYHFLTYGEGERYENVELSTIDTGLLMAGILTCLSYFDDDSVTEKKIRRLADKLYRRVQWDWAMNGNETMSMGWRPEKGFIEAQWKGYNEAMILLIMAMGSPTHPIPGNSWDVWTQTYEWDSFYGYDHVNFSPLFGHQYSHMFIDFREIQDEYMREKGIDYFENSRRATLSNRAYCIDNPKQFKGYSENIWGLTAYDGPDNTKLDWKDRKITFHTYRARGASSRHIIDDGTITPTAAGGSIPFAPEKCIDALYAMYQIYGDRLFQEYGFLDSFNPTYGQLNGGRTWINDDYIGIDQGPILLQMENHESGLIWNILKDNKYIRKGLKKAGFEGGWLENNQD
ncbi:MAG: hypothetical protein K9I68_05160 [Bacteroidales bacterium]|nr:hypothetical protein [Bacteroidales bacterium]MCF8337931.1 hypothetical protein [Bacteroidales bacterium]